MGRLIAVTSGKGGVGKSSVSVHLATALGEMGHRVLLVDLDAGMRCLDILLNLSDRLVFDLGDVLSGAKSVEETALRVGPQSNVSFLAAPLKDKIDATALYHFLRGVCDRYDFLLLDFPAGGVDALYAALPKYTEALVVCNADAVSVRDAGTVGSDLANLQLMSVKLVLNKACFSNMMNGITGNVDDVIDSTGLQLVAVIPESREIYISGCTGAPLKKKGRAHKAFYRLARRMLGYDVPLLAYKKI